MKEEDFAKLREWSIGWISGGCDYDECVKEWDTCLKNILKGGESEHGN